MYDLIGIDGNAFSVIGYTTNAMRETGFTKEEISDYKTDAMSSDYDHLLSISIVMINKCNEVIKQSKIGKMKTTYAVIAHNDDESASLSLLEVCDTYKKAIDFILNEYYKGDSELMEFEYKGNDFWEGNCKGVEILKKN